MLEGPERLRTTGWRFSPAVKIVDFGLAALQQANDASIRRGEHVVGTLSDYKLLPEQARDVKAADAQSDLYSLGCTLYFALVGRAPFAEAHHNFQKVLLHLKATVPRRSTSFGPTCRHRSSSWSMPSSQRIPNDRPQRHR